MLTFVTGEREVDCWKSHHVCRTVIFLIPILCGFQDEGEGKYFLICNCFFYTYIDTIIGVLTMLSLRVRVL